MDKPFKAILVSHTHWDRAWYLPFQVFRIRLVRLVDRLLDCLDRTLAFHSFLLDGQMLALEDYIEIRPERRADLERLIHAGRLHIGPWYVLADEYLVSPEALIRNLLAGTRLAQEWGGVMREGYVPDAFGHIGQLPQILQGFDIGSAVFWRGLGDEGEELGNEFWWQAPDGSRVLAIHLRNRYGNAANLGYPMLSGDPSRLEFDMDLALRRLRQAVEGLAPYAHSNHLLLMNGIDHTEAEPAVPEIIAHANKILADVQIEHGSLPGYMTRVRAGAGDPLPAFQGEFNRSRYAFGLQGVYSSRMYLQQANESAQTLLECYAEPLSAVAWLLGEPYPASLMQVAWRTLLQNHPHDDICGCSVDEVHRENMARFAQVEQLGAALTRAAGRAIARHIDRTAQPGRPIVVFNPAASSRTETAQVELNLDTDQDFYLVDAGGRVVPHQLLSRERVTEVQVNKTTHPYRVRAALALTDLPACGYRVYYALPGGPSESPAVEHPVQVFASRGTAQGMENRWLRIELQADGTLDVLDKLTGHAFHSLGYFLDEEDAGDEYDYAPCAHSRAIRTLAQAAKIRRVYAGPLQAAYEIAREMNLPASLSEDRQRRSRKRVDCSLVTRVTLRYDIRRVDVRTTIHNRARDHRLRVCFPTNLQTNVASADGHFDVLTRPIALPAGAGWEQPPVPTKHQRYFVDVSDGKVGLAIFNRGLPEYEIIPGQAQNTIAVTLLRCVGHLSRGDLATRPVNAGPPLLTPEAQCLGQHAFEYAIAPHAGDWRSIYRDAYAFRAPVVAHRGDEHEGYIPVPSDWGVLEPIRVKAPDLTGDLPAEGSFLSLEPETLALSAVKRGEGCDIRAVPSVVVRFYNPLDEPAQATLKLFRPIRAAQEINLAEQPQAELAIQNQNSVRLPIKGKQVKTVALQF